MLRTREGELRVIPKWSQFWPWTRAGAAERLALAREIEEFLNVGTIKP